MWYKWAGFSVVALAVPAHAADELAFGPTPEWVAVQSIPTTAASSGDSPAELLLSDNQIKLEPGAVHSYSHYAARFNNAQGLAGGNVIAVWDPAFDTATVHRVTILRAGQSIDVLAKGQKFTILRREQNLEQQTLNGRLTATLQPEGLQVGDTLEVEISVIRRDPTLRGHMEMKGGVNVPLRIESSLFRLITPANANIRQRLGGGLTEPVVVKAKGQNISSWSFSPLIPEHSPAFAPLRYSKGKTIDVTDFQNWSHLADLFLPLFEQASKIPDGSTLQAEVARIKAESQDPVKRTELALQLVEDKVRYVNLALGIGGLVPTASDVTWQRRFGDCKAKTALLVGLLRELGIEAVPVLVHSEEGDGLNERLPMVGLFDHVIVRAMIGGKTYWLDGTRTGDKTLASLDTPYYHWGLPIVRNADIVKIVPQPSIRPLVETIIRTDASAGATKPVPTTIELVFRGDVALAQNRIISSLEPSLRDQALREQLKSELDLFEIDKVTPSYDPLGQEYRVRGEGRQTLDLNDGTYWTEVPSLGYKADFRREGTRDLDAPVRIGYPSYSRHVQTIVLPKDLATRAKREYPPIATIVAGVEYRRNVTMVDGAMTIETNRRAVAPEISYAEAVAAQQRLRQLDDDDIGIRLSNSTPVAAAEVKDLLGHEPKSSDDYLQAAIKFLNTRERTKAIGSLDKAIELSPASGQARSLRAQLRMASGDTAGAKADAEAAAKANPKDIEPRLLLGEIHRRAGNFEASRSEAVALGKVDNARAQIASGRLFMQLDRTDDALAAFSRALVYEKDPMTYVYRALSLPAADKTGRRKELDAAMKLNPSDAPSLAALAQIASQVGDHAKALQLLDQAFLRSPDDVPIRHSRAVAMFLAGKTEAANREFEALSSKELEAWQLNEMCWTKALANVALEKALDECNRSLAKNDSAATRDSKGMVLLRMSRFDEAIKEFDEALKASEDMPASLYGRSLAYAGKGDHAKSVVDAAAAKKLSPGIERSYAYDGLQR